MANRLIDEQSPYLLQHAHNPVDWYPWCDEAFEIAKRDNKPVLISIGYAACHWCHVMERESFENPDVAAYMNEHFVCIKVDREEHPDVDHFYMDAVQAISGSGGWPLNVFATPDRAPFFGGTYYPPKPAYSRPSWTQLMQRMSEIWNKQPEEVNRQADQMLTHLRQASARISSPSSNGADEDICVDILETLLKQADKEKGGFGNAPKFPGTMAISYLLEHYHYAGDEEALEHALFSLDSMIQGGIYDQIGGGFARYSTDSSWLAPHFEKMLYDNALLISTMCDAYRITGKEIYRTTIQQTISFINAELKDNTGGFYCALDADSEGVEGKFYTWTWEEWQQHAGDDSGMAAKHFGVLPEGNWEGTNILHIVTDVETIAAQKNLTIDEVNGAIDSVKTKLLKARAKRVRPQTDDKCLLSWNALMNMALTKAGVALQNAEYLAQAGDHMEWMLATYQTRRELVHTWKSGKSRITANLDDYAYLIQAMLLLGSAVADNELIAKAITFTTLVVEQFGREDGFFYYTSSAQKDVPVRKVDLYDGATPSANSVMAYNLWVCGMCDERSSWVEQAVSMLKNMSATAARYAYSFANWGIVLQRNLRGMNTVVVGGGDALRAAAEISSKYLPHAYLVTCEKEICELPILEKKLFGSNLSIFVCTEQACLSPVSSVREAFNLISK